MKLLNEIIKEFLNESVMGYIPIWLSSNGEAEKVSSHADYGASVLGNGLDPLDYDDIEKIYDGMYDLGYIRVTVEPREIMFDYGDKKAPSRKQLSILKDNGIEQKLIVSNAKTGRILYSPYN
jgi:hypothetical protein